MIAILQKIFPKRLCDCIKQYVFLQHIREISKRSFKSTIGLLLFYSKVMVLSFLLNSVSLI